jgi:hypothetical protein
VLTVPIGHTYGCVQSWGFLRMSLGGFPKWFTFRERKYEGGFANGSLNGIFLERYFVRYFVVSLVG